MAFEDAPALGRAGGRSAFGLLEEVSLGPNLERNLQHQASLGGCGPVMPRCAAACQASARVIGDCGRPRFALHWTADPEGRMGRTLAAAVGLALAGAGIAHAADAFVDPSGWQVGPVAASPSNCSARLPGPQVDIILMVNNQGKLVLTAGHGAWNRIDRGFVSQIRVDGGPATPLVGDGVGPLFLGLVGDDLFRRLRGARAIDWTLPAGQFHIAVAGLGAAFDETVACEKSG